MSTAAGARHGPGTKHETLQWGSAPLRPVYWENETWQPEAH